MNPILIAAGLSAAGTVVSNAWNAREAAKNRAFQERMSSTAHRREVADLRGAGINPMARSMGGASAPSGDRAEMRDPVGPAIASALAVKQAQANIELTREQSNLVRAQQNDLLQRFNAGSFEKYQSETEMARLNVAQQRELLPVLLQKARAEVEATLSSARAARATAALDELAKSGAMNEAEFAERIGEAGPWAKALFNLMRLMRR